MTYTHLIALTKPANELQTKEYLDIALVSASYEISTAVFLTHPVIHKLQQTETALLRQTFNMLAEFSIPLFTEPLFTEPLFTEPLLAENHTRLFGQVITAIDFDALCRQSKHLLLF